MRRSMRVLVIAIGVVVVLLAAFAIIIRLSIGALPLGISV
jgi:hypothetical protein